MVAVPEYNKVLSCYLIALKLKETVKSGLQNAQNPTRSIEFPAQSHQEHLQKQENQGPTSPKSAWVISIKEKLDQARQEDAAGSWAKLCIYRVPQCLREGDDKAYIPQIVSLGPYHHGRRRLRNMDHHKWRALYHVLKRANQDIKLYLDAVKELEEKARDCYEGSITLGSNEFVKMMVLDGCFILELFRGIALGFRHLGYSRNDPIFNMRGSVHSILRDMIMLENQIPLFILDRLLGLQIGNPDQQGMVAKLALGFFDPLMPTDESLTNSDRNNLKTSIGNSSTFDPLPDHGGVHCLEVFRRSLLVTRAGTKPTPRIWKERRTNSKQVTNKRKQQIIRSVTELKNAGIKFKKRKTDRFWDIDFKNGILEIPRLLIHDGTKSLFLNLIAFEQCHLDCTNKITSYLIFMDNLIDSAEDVSYLHHSGIIRHWLGSDAEVAELFNRLCQEVAFDVKDSYLSKLSEEVNKYYENIWNTRRASLKLKYFNSPWKIISFIAAVFLLLLTMAQTFYEVYGYYRPSS